MQTTTILAILVLVGLVVFWVVRSALRQKAERERRMLALGFDKVQTPPDWLAGHLIDLAQKRDAQDLKVRNVYARRQADAQFYVFDLTDYAGEGSSDLYDQAVAVVSPQLDLPRFTLTFKIAQEGKAADLANLFLAKMAARDGLQIRFDAHPEFQRRYLVIGDDEIAVRSFFTDERLHWLSQTEYWRIEAQGDLFIFDEIKIDLARKRSEVRVEDRLDDAQRVFDVFRIGGTG
jgi:hypothetical protein